MATTGLQSLTGRMEPTAAQAQRPVVLHILPQDGIGGAEIAANIAARANPNVHLLFLSSPAANAPPPHPRVLHAASSFPLAMSTLHTVAEAMRQIRPDIVVFSMWKSFPAYLLVSLGFSRAKRVVLFHNERAVHAIDAIFSNLMAASCHGIWSDCSRTARRAAKYDHAKHLRPLSFVMWKSFGSPRKKAKPRCIFWGRLTYQKNLPKALDIIYRLKDRYTDVSLTVIGPDAGALSGMRSKIETLSLDNDVSFTDYQPREKIAELAKSASFFLQLSHYEGMAMSVVEAMQLGLVPVVTPVGEIANYCRHMENGIIHRDIASTVAAIEQVIADPARYTAMSRAAIETWRDAPLYADDFAAAAAELFARTGAGAGAKGPP